MEYKIFDYTSDILQLYFVDGGSFSELKNTLHCLIDGTNTLKQIIINYFN